MADKARLHRYPLQTDSLPSPKTRLSDDEEEEDEEDDHDRSASASEHLPASSTIAADTQTPASARLLPPIVTGAFRPQSSSSRRSLPRHQSSQGQPPVSASRSRPKHRRHGNSSSTSIDSNALLDHRDQPHSISRNMSHRRLHKRRDGDYSSEVTSERDEEQEEEDEETMRLMAAAARGQRQSYAPWTKPRRTSVSEATGLLGSSDRLDMYGSSSRPFTSSGVSPPKSAPRRSSPTRSGKAHRYSHINHPSSVPSSIGSPPPQRGGRTYSLVGTGADGEMLSMQLAPRAQRRLTAQGVPTRAGGDVLIDIEPPHSPNDLSTLPAAISQSPPHSSIHSSSSSIRSRERRKTYKAEEDVCFPTEDPSPKAPWPDYTVLEEWAAEESKALDEGSSAVRNGEGGFLSREGHRKVSEPVMVDGRYRRAFTFPSAISYDETDETRPYRFTFFTDKLATTVHSPTISELVDEGESFSDLFEGEGCECWWLDICNVTDEEMRVLSRAFSIHPLTTEDIATLEPREKVELFRSYYLVSLRSFEQDPTSTTYLSPLSLYMIVFRNGILTFHQSPTPHPANVRRRIRQLKDYIQVSADWICYALIDDIVDGFAPLLEGVEQQVDAIDEGVLRLHQEDDEDVDSGAMLQRIGLARKKVMGLLRLLGSKADVIKGFSKRCNEKWEVAPRSEIGLYLGDIQDHIITMVQNLNHYEKILSRSHSNYLAQISIEMAKANNDTNDTLSRLSVLGTILVPMNLVTGLWGMNVLVPGQVEDHPTLTYFFSIMGCLMAFAVFAVFTLRRIGLV